MFTTCQHRILIAAKTESILQRLWLILMASGKVTILLFMLAIPGAVQAHDVNGIDLRLFEFDSEFYMLMGRGSLYGLMATDGSQHRIAIYWIEPEVYRDHTFFLGRSDFIFSKERVHYWIYGMSQPVTFNLSEKKSVPLLPGDVSVESVARSALAIVSRIRSQSEQGDIPLEVGKFFRQSLDQNNYSYEVPSELPSSEEASGNSVTDMQILNALPFGRKYSKETQRDGTIVWQAQRVLDGPHIARVTVKPVSDMDAYNVGAIFDPNTLGQWMLVPEQYRACWSFDQGYSELKDGTDNTLASRQLHKKIEAYIDKNEVPVRIDCAFNQLLFKTALLTGDVSRVSRSAHGVVAALCRDSSMNSYEGLLELARIDAQIRENYPNQSDELLRPLIGQMVRHAGPDVPQSLERLMTSIENNRWFSYGNLLFEEARIQNLLEEDVADKLGARLEAARLARDRKAPDPHELTPTVKQYLAQLDADPPEGTLTMDDVREILEKGLEKPFADANMVLKHELIEYVVSSIRLIAGEGPFRGDKAKLIESVERFSGLYLVVFRYKEPIDTVLSTFLALSFCDISTVEDHDVLFSQIHKLCEELQSELNTMLSERGLNSLVTPNDVEGVFRMYERKFRRYIDDPLWPAFKFPLTANERTRLRNKLNLHFMQLELKPLFEEMALKVKYGGTSPELKDKTLNEISRAAQSLLPQAAFLRRPSYPGVTCRYRGQYGFTAVIKGPLYIEGERPKEKFKAMKYFHMGHRIEDIVKRERELAGGR